MPPLKMVFSPGRIGTLNLANRIVLPAMEPGLADGEGLLDGDRAGRHYALRARGGAGLVVTGNVAVQPHGRAAGAQAGLWGDHQVEPFATMVEQVHHAGGRVAIQLSHAGREVHPLLGWEAVGPTDAPSAVFKNRPRGLSIDEIEAAINDFASAAQRAVSAGADAIEIHGAHGYLINQFLSPLMNLRSDSWGGDTVGRARFAIAVVQSIRKVVGPSFPLLFRISADEYTPGGIEVDEAAEIAGLIAEAGADAISVSACTYESSFFNLPNYYLEEGCFVPLARHIRREVDVPVITVGRIRSVAMAEEIITRGDADFVAMGRSLLADPYIPVKTRQDHHDTIRPCLSCNRCIESLSHGPLVCTVNPWLFDEEWPVPKPPPDSTGQRVFVAGSGPAGLTAASILMRQGHQVTLYDRDPDPGGRLVLAGLPPRKGAIEEYRTWLVGEARRSGVELRLGEALTLDEVVAKQPALTVVATGSKSAQPPFTVADGAPVYTITEAFLAPERLGSRVCIVGGGAEGAELADFLSEGEIQVVLLEAKRKVARELVPAIRHFLLQRLEDKRVQVISRFRVSHVDEGWVNGTVGANRAARQEGFSSIVIATGLRPLRSLADDLMTEGLTVRVIGDASSPRSILEAVREGAATTLG